MRVDAPRFVRRRLGLTPLIDVIFLLLLFFMLSSTFSRFSQVPVEGGTAGRAGGNRPDAMISVRANDVRLNGEGIETGAIAARLAELKDVHLVLHDLLLPCHRVHHLVLLDEALHGPLLLCGQGNA